MVRREHSPERPGAPSQQTGQWFYARQALLPDGWQSDVVWQVDADGCIAQIWHTATAHDRAQAHDVGGPVLPGLVNAHTHSFQRAMAGLCQRAGATGDDNFWTWREVMYRFLARLGPAEIEAIAAQLYGELLRRGFTTVVEFHYLHHSPDGTPYADPAELALRLVAAASRVGIGLTLLPVLYAYSGFGGLPPTQGQRRFVHNIDSYLVLYERLREATNGLPGVRLGMAPHSLRAVSPEQLTALHAYLDRHDPLAPIHLHIAEQQAEVTACVDRLGMRPVAWLLDHAPISSRHCLVHATHMSERESLALARSGAVVGLCPSTEADLGDGCFAGAEYLLAGGTLAIGTDSNVGIDPFDELRLLEYSQRLSLRRRNVLAHPGQSVGASLFRAAQRGGALAAGQATSGLQVGAHADFVVLNPDALGLCGQTGDGLLDALIFAPQTGVCVQSVWSGGRHVVVDGVSTDQDLIAHRYRQVAKVLAA